MGESGNHREPPSSGLEVFSPPSALRATSGETLLKPAQVVLANAGGLVSGQWNSERGSWATLFHYSKGRIISAADQRLCANLVDPHPRGNSHDSAGAGKMWGGTAGNGKGARFCAQAARRARCKLYM